MSDLGFDRRSLRTRMMNGSGTAAGLAAALPALLDKGYAFTTLGAALP